MGSSLSCSLRRRVFSVLHGEDDARAVVQTVAVFFGEIIDALAAGDFTFGQESLTDRVAEFARPGLCRLQGHRDHTLEHLKGIVGISGDITGPDAISTPSAAFPAMRMKSMLAAPWV